MLLRRSSIQTTSPQLPGRAEVAEPTTGIEPVASSLPRKCSTPELRGLKSHKHAGVERETGFEPATLSLEG
jgi:hypothetical protein